MTDSLITVTGIEDVQKMLAEAPRTLVASGFVKALSAGINVIADGMEPAIPIKAEDTGGILDRGELRESLMTAVELDSQLRGGVAECGFGKNGVVAEWIEYGHRLVGHKPGKKLLGAIPARPFMRPAADIYGEAAIDAFAESLVSTITQNFPQGPVK